MRAFAWLEVGIAVTALLYFGVIALFRSIYPTVYQHMPFPALRFATKGLLAICLILPPAFFMGGTLPMIGQAMIHHRDAFGRRAAWLYAVNTIGAALGAFATGFFLIRLLGFTWTCILAIRSRRLRALRPTSFRVHRMMIPATCPQGLSSPLRHAHRTIFFPSMQSASSQASAF